MCCVICAHVNLEFRDERYVWIAPFWLDFGGVGWCVVQQHSVDFVKACVDKGVQVDYMIYPGHEHNVLGKDRAHLYQKVTDYFMQHLQQ